MLDLTDSQLPLIPEPVRLIAIPSAAGDPALCSVPEVLAALIESPDAISKSELAFCRAFFNRLSLLRSSLTRSHQWSR